MKKLLLWLVILGAAGRIAAAVFYRAVPLSTGGDDVVYFEAGLNSAEGKGLTFLGRPLNWRGPLYPQFISAAARLGAKKPGDIRLVQAVLSCLVLAGVYYAGKAAFSPMAGLCAAALLAANPEQILLPTSLYSEFFYGAVLLAFAAAFVRWAKAPSPGRAALAGGTLGLCLSCKSFLALFPLVWLVFLIRRNLPGKRLSQAAAFAAAMAALLAVESSPKRGLPFERGISGPVLWYASLGMITTPQDETELEPFRTVSRVFPHEKWDGLLYPLAASNIAENPRRYAVSCAKRAWYLFSESYTCYLLYYHPALRNFALRNWEKIRRAGTVFFAGLVFLAALGVLRHSATARPLAALGLYFGLYVFFAAFARFLSPAVPVITLLAGAGLAGLIKDDNQSQP